MNPASYQFDINRRWLHMSWSPLFPILPVHDSSFHTSNICCISSFPANIRCFVSSPKSIADTFRADFDVHKVSLGLSRESTMQFATNMMTFPGCIRGQPWQRKRYQLLSSHSRGSFRSSTFQWARQNHSIIVCHENAICIDAYSCQLCLPSIASWLILSSLNKHQFHVESIVALIISAVTLAKQDANVPSVIQEYDPVHRKPRVQESISAGFQLGSFPLLITYPRYLPWIPAQFISVPIFILLSTIADKQIQLLVSSWLPVQNTRICVSYPCYFFH